MGCGGLAIVIVLALVFGINPMQLLGGGGVSVPQEPIGQPQVQRAGAARAPKPTASLPRCSAPPSGPGTMCSAREVGAAYRPPKLVLFSGGVRSGCGAAQSAMGPFYCPADQKVYLDQSFFDDLSRRFGAPGDFAAAYVIAHEVGHHVQTLLGISDQVQQLQARASKTQGNAIQVRMELQADCLAGVWGHHNAGCWRPATSRRRCAPRQSIGDDTLQKRRRRAMSCRKASPMARRRSGSAGSCAAIEAGTIAACDTFGARRSDRLMRG